MCRLSGELRSITFKSKGLLIPSELHKFSSQSPYTPQYDDKYTMDFSYLFLLDEDIITVLKAKNIVTPTIEYNIQNYVLGPLLIPNIISVRGI